MLSWDAPPGEWQVVASYLLPSGEVPIGAAQKPQGFVVDHLRKPQVLGHYEYAFGKRTGLPAHYGKGLRGIFNDSLEFRVKRMGVEDILTEFRARRGYDLEPLLPAIYIEGKDSVYFSEIVGIHAAPEFALSPRRRAYPPRLPEDALGPRDRAFRGDLGKLGREPRARLARPELRHGDRHPAGARREGAGQVVLLTGEAGIGKSRLVREFERALAAEPHLRISNQCSPLHADSALHPVIRQLTQAAGLGHGEEAETQHDRLDALLAGAGRPDSALIAALLGIDGARRYVPLDVLPEQLRARTFEALLGQVERLSRREPLLWVLEDAHWIDPTTMELVANCVDRVASLPVLVVVTARPDFAHRFPDRGHVSRVSLGRLERRHEQLVHALRLEDVDTALGHQALARARRERDGHAA